MKRIVLSIVFVICAYTSVLAQTAKPEQVGLSSERLKRVHDLMERRIAARDISGAVTLVARNGQIAYLDAQGVMDIETNKPMTKDAIFRIASMTKPIVGTAILMMMEEGKVRLTDPVSRFIPEFKELKVAVAQPAPGQAGARGAAPRFYAVPAEREITIKDLLTHTSGLVSGSISTAEAGKIQRKPGETLADYIPRLGQVPLEFQPGSRWSYSPGAGFDTLGRIVEIVSGQSLDQFLKQRIFDPLGMKDTFFNISEPQKSRVVTMYQKTAKGLEKSANQPAPPTTYFSGSGGLSSTADDYVKFAQMLVNGGQLNGKRLLSPRSVELMGSPFAPDTLPGRARGEAWGLSVRVITDAVARGTYLSNGSFGWQGAFGTHFWVDPKEKLVGLLLVQTSNQEMIRDFENAVLQSVVE
ncbi:MAG TPA: serine hydrolase domain-containing protein [Terriglobia bacterium]|jgi:CubicO group peptidase (beta-lactamase class C family)